MTTVTIPAWSAEGVLPPMDAANPTSVHRSPYRVAMTDVALHFATSPQRVSILDGLLRYRQAFYAAGIVSGFQWLNGSFMEDIETLECRAPRDMDVVTFLVLPAGQTQSAFLAQHMPLFDRKQTKAQFAVDAFPVCLGGATHRLVERSCYWYSLWSHRRSLQWKGFLEVALDPSVDAIATANLAAVRGEAHD